MPASVQIIVFSGRVSRSGIVGSYGNSIFLVFLITSIQFSIVAAPRFFSNRREKSLRPGLG